MKFNVKLGNVKYVGPQQKDQKERESFECNDIQVGVEFEPQEYVEVYKVMKDFSDSMDLAGLAKVALNHLVSEEAKDGEVSREERKSRIFGFKKATKKEKENEDLTPDFAKKDEE